MNQFFIPELGTPKKGKVRDLYDIGKSLVMVTSDRISVFDCILENPIPQKGKILNDISKYWFDQTKDIIGNHFINQPDPNVWVVKKCTPLSIEVIVRGFVVGSLWRDYEKGKRVKCGILLPDGLKQNDPLPKPILTPTTKSHGEHDEDITPAEILNRGIVSQKLWDDIEKKAFELFHRGQEVAKKNGLILVDTKYEFGLDENNQLLLIDEVHTPDSSRYFMFQEGKKKSFSFPDKEFARQWAISQGFMGHGKPPFIPDEIILKIHAGYKDVYEKVTGMPLKKESCSTPKRILSNLIQANLVKGIFILILAESEKDRPLINQITDVFKDHSIPYQVIIDPSNFVTDLIDCYNQSIEPMVCAIVASRSNAFSEVAAHLKWPTIAVVDPKKGAMEAINILKTVS